MGITGSMKREEGKCRALNWGKEEIKRMKEEEKKSLDVWMLGKAITKPTV